MTEQPLLPGFEPAPPGAQAPEPADPFDLALALVRSARFDQALPFATAAFERDPNDPDAVFLCAIVHAELGNLAESRRLFDESQLLARYRKFGFDRSAVTMLREVLGRARRPEPRPGPRVPARKPAPAPSPVTAAALPAAISGKNPTAPEIALAPPALDALTSLLAMATATAADPATALGDYRLRQQAHEIERLRGYDTLLALHAIHGVDHYDHQLRTVRRVLREFRGRVLLADEVGLGKTVEACLCLKEYLLRGLVRSVLIVVPAPLVLQWQDELRGKFGIEAAILESADLRENAEPPGPGVHLVSLGTARLPQPGDTLARGRFDLVIVDEAHRLKNRRTRSWQLVDRLRARYLFLLSATPVENDLVEIYNVLTLLKPGLFSTEADFRRAFVSGKGRTPKDPARLRALLREVMVRNTRALIDLQLPPRFATTLRASPEGAEAELYSGVAAAVRERVGASTLSMAAAGELLRALGCAPGAGAAALARHLGEPFASMALAFTKPGAQSAKDRQLLELLGGRPREKVLLFVGARAHQGHVLAMLQQHGHRTGVFHGSLSRQEKEQAIAAFAQDVDVLVASDSGGEGFNLQFARTVVNYDLPWNPMRIEQRIGRVHRIGQSREVFVFNLVTSGTVEDEVLRVLDEKINMFELVVGEIDAILGRLGDDEREFQELVLELWARAGGETEARAAFDGLAERVLSARADYGKVKQFEDAVLGEELGGMSAAGTTDRVREWVKDLLLREGAVLEEQPGGALYACLPAHLQQRLALPEAALLRVCEPAAAGETGVELEAAAMQGCLDIALARGTLAAARLPRSGGRHEHFQEHAARALQVDNAAVRRGEVARRPLRWLVFGFGWTGTADERTAGRVLVAHQPALGVTSAATAQALLAALPDAEPIGGSPARAEVESAAAAAWPAAAAAIRSELQPFAQGARQRQAREERRLAGYYDKLVAEAGRRRGRAAAGAVAGPDRRAAIEHDRQQKLAQLAERFTIRCEVNLEDLLVVEHETTVAELLIRRKAKERAVTVAWDPWQREPMARDCEACGRAGRSFRACDDAVHLVCPACRASRCPVCARGKERV